jgi:hypothetical protein
MIYKNELRLGNLVFEEVIGNVIISKLREKTCLVDVNNLTTENKIEVVKYHLNYDSINPILITEDWLYRFGFKRKDDGFYFLDIGNDTIITSDGKEFWIDKIVGGIDVSVGLGGGNTVHGLQNLYYTMTNKELILRNYLSFSY